MYTLEHLRTIAARMDLVIDEDHVVFNNKIREGYWILDAETREGVWLDDNFSISLEEVEGKLQQIAAERGLRWEE